MLGRGHVEPWGVSRADEVGGPHRSEGVGLAALHEGEADAVAGGLERQEIQGEKRRRGGRGGGIRDGYVNICSRSRWRRAISPFAMER